jgi:hypothetical protein
VLFKVYTAFGRLSFEKVLKDLDREGKLIILRSVRCALGFSDTPSLKTGTFEKDRCFKGCFVSKSIFTKRSQCNKAAIVFS